ncbi:hypothetical protein OIE66_40315 [Nonomuraea sp. NBC_01738]|nr:hypothetical protein OIE66_40315 [Nonomuraea sp. NBC_01738]
MRLTTKFAALALALAALGFGVSQVPAGGSAGASHVAAGLNDGNIWG